MTGDKTETVIEGKDTETVNLPKTLEDALKVLADLSAKQTSAEARISELNKESAKHRKAASDAEKAAKDAEAAELLKKGNYEALLAKEKADHELTRSELKSLTRQLMLERVGKKVQLPEDLTDYIKGETEDEMLASAKTLAKGRVSSGKLINDGEGGAPGRNGRAQDSPMSEEQELELQAQKQRNGRYPARW